MKQLWSRESKVEFCEETTTSLNDYQYVKWENLEDYQLDKWIGFFDSLSEKYIKVKHSTTTLKGKQY